MGMGLEGLEGLGGTDRRGIGLGILGVGFGGLGRVLRLFLLLWVAW